MALAAQRTQQTTLESRMISVPDYDPVHAFVPHTLKEPLVGRRAGLLAGTTFMVKDLFAIAGHKVSIGNPEWYAAASPAAETAPALLRLLDAGATLTGITICDEFLYSVLGTNVHYGQPVNIHALRPVTESDLPRFNLPGPEPHTLDDDSIARLQDGRVNVRSALDDSGPVIEQQGLGTPAYADFDSALVYRHDCAFDAHMPSTARFASLCQP